MARMRGLAPAFIIGVGGLFVLFMVISDSNVLEALGGRTNDVGFVNGTAITYQEFQFAVDQQTEMRKNQTGKDLEESEFEQIREQVWESLVTQKLLKEQIDKYGITVSDEEIKDVILGENPPQFLMQNFIDSTGKFNRQMYESAIRDPRNKDAMVQAEELVRQQRLTEKLQSMLLAGIVVGDQEVKQRFIEQNTKMNVEYALIDLSLFPDSEIKYDENDLKSYYNNNLDKYKILAQRKLKFVLFPNVPSADDSAQIKKDMENIKAAVLRDTLDFKANVEIYSSLPYSRDTLVISAIPEQAANKIYNSSPGLIGPVATYEGYCLYNFLGTVASGETQVRASHILINQMGSDEKNLEEANRIYQQLISGADFAKIAKEKSGDPGSGARGGDLGWFGKGAMVPEFEKACFEGKVGEVQKPVKTSYGYHIIKVTARSDRKYVVEKIVNPVKQSATSRDIVFNQANDFSYIAQKNGFEKEAKTLNYSIQETTPFQENALSIPILGNNKRLLKFAFENGVNTVSDVFKVSNGFVVVMVSEVIKEGVKPFEEVKDLVKIQVVREKKYEKAKQLASDLKRKINGDLNRVAEFNPNVKVLQSGEFTPLAPSPSVGRDFGFIDAALKLEPNKISDPVKGLRGYYLMKLTGKTPFDETAFNNQKSMLKQSILTEKKNAYFTQWLAKLKEDAEIEDNRHIFFGQ
ncbi:MAG: peptidylprolyl isomerase [Ignavibacteriaceae bacterium]|nr:peptidylprolyl isomerase [Ignavibacteriaceae bacterium]